MIFHKTHSLALLGLLLLGPHKDVSFVSSVELKLRAGPSLDASGVVEPSIDATPPKDNKCDGDEYMAPIVIESSLLLDFAGFQGLVIPAEVNVLERQFTETFENLTSVLCDPLGASFTIEQLIFLSGHDDTETFQERRALTDSGGGGGGGGSTPTFTYPARVQAKCTGKGCPTNNMLFREDGGSFRALKEGEEHGSSIRDPAKDAVSEVPLDGAKRRDLTGTSCGACKAPTINQFAQAYNADIQDLYHGNVIGNVQGFEGIIPLTAIECSGEESEFEDFVDIDFFGDPDLLGPSDIDILGSQIVQDYNFLAVNLCDPFFRRLVAADVIDNDDDGGGRGLRQSRNLQRRFRRRFRLRGRCRGCRRRRRSRVFDDAVRRLGTRSVDPDHSPHRSLQSIPEAFVCVCDPAVANDPAARRAPTASEFTALYAESVEALDIDGVDTVLETEVVPTAELPPTVAPSAVAPTPQPTLRPTPQPIPVTPPCGGSCDDGDLCTMNRCDTGTDTCITEPVVCGTDEACDSFTGLCQNIQNIVPCVAVIDEWNNRNYTSEWASFRARYPQRPFCLLVPNSFIQTLPAGFDLDTLNNPDGVDRTLASNVNRDNGNVNFASNWFDICNLGALSPSSVGFVGLFIDTSGSMRLSTVRASYEQFLSNLTDAGLGFQQVFNSVERWIDPFLTTLAPPT